MLIKLSPRYGLDFTDDEVDKINSHRLSKADDTERQGRARGREEEEEEREGKSFDRHRQHDAEEVETVCQTENRDTEVKVSF